jgi:hypothetical protein
MRGTGIILLVAAALLVVLILILADACQPSASGPVLGPPPTTTLMAPTPPLEGATRTSSAFVPPATPGLTSTPQPTAIASPSSDQVGSSEVKTIDDLFATVANQHSGFGGMYIDEEQDTIYVFLLNGDLNGVVKELKKVLGEQSLPQRKAQALPATYSFLQLKEWHDHMAQQVFQIPEVTLTDVDDAKNRLLVGVETPEARAPVEKQLQALNIPNEAVTMEVTGPIELSTTTAQCISQLTVPRVFTQDTGGTYKTTFTPGEPIQFVAEVNNSSGYLLGANGTQLAITTSFYTDTDRVDIPTGSSTWTWNAPAPATKNNYTVTVRAYEHSCSVWVGGSQSFTVTAPAATPTPVPSPSPTPSPAPTPTPQPTQLPTSTPACPQPTLTLSASLGKVGDQIPVQGAGGLPGGTVTLFADPHPRQAVMDAVPVPASGVWESRIGIGTLAGDYQLVFSEASGGCDLRVTKPFTIVEQATPTPPVPPPPPTVPTSKPTEPTPPTASPPQPPPIPQTPAPGQLPVPTQPSPVRHTPPAIPTAIPTPMPSLTATPIPHPQACFRRRFRFCPHQRRLSQHQPLNQYRYLPHRFIALQVVSA